MSRVYLSHLPKSTPSRPFDFSDLKRFGEVFYMDDRSTYPDDVNVRVRELSAWAQAFFKEFEAIEDYLCLAGDPVLMAIATIAATRQAMYDGYDSIRLLKWDGQSRAYYSITVPVANIGGPNELHPTDSR